MQSSVVTVIACTPILTACLAVLVHRCLAACQLRRQQARWTQLVAALPELDAELDRAWTAEQARIRRFR